jgi:hypothetical protein
MNSGSANLDVPDLVGMLPQTKLGDSRANSGALCSRGYNIPPQQPEK